MTTSSHSFLTNRTFFKPSERTLGEQLVGFSIFLTLNLGWGLLNSWITEFSKQGEWPHEIIKSTWVPSGWLFIAIWILFYLSQTVSIWSLWRLNFFRTMKLELSLYSSQFVLQILWFISFFWWQEISLALVILLMQFIATMMSFGVFWKREKVSGILMILPLASVIFILILNMAICILRTEC